MIRRLRDALGGGTSRQAADAVGRGMADVLAALDNVIDDDAALGRIYAGFGTSVPAAAPGRGAGTAADGACAPNGTPEPATTTARAGRPAASRRRLALRSAAGVAAALVAGAVALVAVGVPGARHDGTGLTGYVVKGVSNALSAADSGTFAQMTVTTSVAPVAGGKTTTTTAEEWSYGDRWRSVTNSAAGRPVYGEGFGPSSGYTLVSYPRRTWARLAGVGRPAEPSPGARGCGRMSVGGPVLFQPSLPGTGLAPKSLLTVARTLHAAVSCGTLDVAARQRVDGVEAIKLTSGRNSLISETIWVSPGTYLPMRVVLRSLPGRSLVLGPDVVLRQTADFTWLPPAPQNLAKLTVPIPAGFRHVPYGRAVLRIAQLMPHGLPLGASASGPKYAGHHPPAVLPYKGPRKSS